MGRLAALVLFVLVVYVIHWPPSHTFVPGLKKAVAAQPTFIGFYVGSGDGRFRDENLQFDRELTSAGVPHVFRLYPGGHEQAVWAKAIAYLSVVQHFEPFSKGVIDTKDLVFFVSMIFFGLFLTARSMESLRWRA